jgi:ECF transporter, substrate-specific component
MQVKRITLTAFFAALCVIGGLIKIPSGIGSLALDTVPALISAAFLPPVFSGVAAMLGHTASAMYAGFPLGPFHVLIALEMLVIVIIFARLHKAGRNVTKWIFFIVANGLLAPLPFYFLISPAFFLGAIPFLLLATIVNAVVAAVVMPSLQHVMAGRLGELR